MYSEKITQLIALGAKSYAKKDFDEAATAYADACAAYNEENESDDPDLLFLYGKALFQNGVSNSGVLGGVSAAGDETGPSKNTGEGENEEDDDESEGFRFHEGVAEEIEEGEAKEVDGVEEETKSVENTDEHTEENGVSSDENQPVEEEQTDFEAAWDVLDLTRSFFEKAMEEDADNERRSLTPPFLASDSQEPVSKYVETVKKLSETYDLLGEVSLETENFPQAAVDLQSCLELREKLYDARLSSLVSESHYKLSLALEFCAEDPELRAKAALHVKQAIEIVKAQVETQKNLDEAAKREKSELLQDLEERYSELQKDPEQEVQEQQMDMIKGLLGEGGSSSSAAQALSEALTKKTAPVNDLSSMVKKRKAKPDQGQAKKPKKD